MNVKMKILSFRDFMKKYKLRSDTMNESPLQKTYIFPIYPRDSGIYSDEPFVNIDNGSMGGSHWTCFLIKDNRSYYFDSIGGQPDEILLNQLPKPIKYHNYKIKDRNSKLSGSYCLYFFFYLIERMKYNDTFLKKYFDSIL